MLAALLGVGAGLAGSAPAPSDAPPNTARAVAIRVLLPGQPPAGTAWVAAPPPATPLATGAFAYPADGSAVTAVSTNASAGADTTATATSGATSLVLFGGEITADAVLGRAAAVSGTSGADGDFNGTTAQNLQALGVPVTQPQTPLADWGTLTLNASNVDRSGPVGGALYSGAITAVDIHLNVDHGGLPAGTEIQIGYAEVMAHQLVPPPTTSTTATSTAATTTEPTTTSTKTVTTVPATTTTRAPEPKPQTRPKPQTTPKPPPAEPSPAQQEPPPVPEPPPGLFPIPPELSPALEGGPYVFPIFGQVAYGDTYGEFRGDVSYHHGDDVFGELGQPVVALADGTIFSLGWNKIGGNRLWLRDRQGNAFYYAHLSAFSTLVFNGARVKAGQVIGFMGHTGDAEGTPPHLHFEVHPVSLLYLGYDGAMDPTPFLDKARRLQRLPFPVPPGWAPSVQGGNAAPEAGAILLSVSDISSADGLDPQSLQQAMNEPHPRP